MEFVIIRRLWFMGPVLRNFRMLMKLVEYGVPFLLILETNARLLGLII